MIRHGEHRRMVPDDICGGGCRRAKPQGRPREGISQGDGGRSGRSGIVWQAEKRRRTRVRHVIATGSRDRVRSIRPEIGESSMHHVRLKALAIAIAMAAASSVCAGTAHTTSSALFTTVRHATTLHTGDRVVGPLHVAVSLKLRNKAQLDAFIANPHHPNLTSAQFNALYAPTQAQAQQVADF